MSLTTVRPVVSFDVDRVVAGGEYIPPQERIQELYWKLPLTDPRLPPMLNQIAKNCDLYFVSARSFPGANVITRAWLAWQGVDMTIVAGTLTGRAGHEEKLDWLKLLNPALHVEDHPEVLKALGPERTIAVRSPLWPAQAEMLNGWSGFVIDGNWDDLIPYINRKLFGGAHETPAGTETMQALAEEVGTARVEDSSGVQES